MPSQRLQGVTIPTPTYSTVGSPTLGATPLPTAHACKGQVLGKDVRTREEMYSINQ